MVSDLDNGVSLGGFDGKHSVEKVFEEFYVSEFGVQEKGKGDLIPEEFLVEFEEAVEGVFFEAAVYSEGVLVEEHLEDGDSEGEDVSLFFADVG